MGTFGNNSGDDGNPTVVKIDDRQWGTVKELIHLQENEIDKADGLVDAKVIMDELRVSKKTLSNMVSAGKITPDMYTVAPNGLKKFFIKKVLGIEK
jgi:hypothetical protein